MNQPGVIYTINNDGLVALLSVSGQLTASKTMLLEREMVKFSDGVVTGVANLTLYQDGNPHVIEFVTSMMKLCELWFINEFNTKSEFVKAVRDGESVRIQSDLLIGAGVTSRTIFTNALILLNSARAFMQASADHKYIGTP